MGMLAGRRPRPLSTACGSWEGSGSLMARCAPRISCIPTCRRRKSRSDCDARVSRPPPRSSRRHRRTIGSMSCSGSGSAGSGTVGQLLSWASGTNDSISAAQGGGQAAKLVVAGAATACARPRTLLPRVVGRGENRERLVRGRQGVDLPLGGLDALEASGAAAQRSGPGLPPRLTETPTFVSSPTRAFSRPIYRRGSEWPVSPRKDGAARPRARTRSSRRVKMSLATFSRPFNASRT